MFAHITTQPLQIAGVFCQRLKRVVFLLQLRMLPAIFVPVFHRILDLKRGLISIWPFFSRTFFMHSCVVVAFIKLNSQDEYMRGNVYTNIVEGFFFILKRGIYGISH